MRDGHVQARVKGTRAYIEVGPVLVLGSALIGYDDVGDNGTERWPLSDKEQTVNGDCTYALPVFNEHCVGVLQASSLNKNISASIELSGGSERRDQQYQSDITHPFTVSIDKTCETLNLPVTLEPEVLITTVCALIP